MDAKKNTRNKRPNRIKIWVCGRKFSGKSTFIDLINMEDSLIRCEETSPSKLIKTYQEKDEIIFIDSPYLLCLQRSGQTISLKDIDQQDKELSFVTELPNCTIVKNDSSLHALKVQAKKIIKEYI